MYNVSLILGDGIGPELSESAIAILETIHDKHDLKFSINKLLAGDSAIEKTGKALPNETFDAIKNSDVCLKAPVGESAKDVIVFLRQSLDLYANIRPAKSYANMPALRDDIDLVIVRENTEDLYTGDEFDVDKDISIALRRISSKASKRIAKYACLMAEQRNKEKKKKQKKNPKKHNLIIRRRIRRIIIIIIENLKNELLKQWNLKQLKKNKLNIIIVTIITM